MKYDSAKELEALFYENEAEFRSAAEKLIGLLTEHNSGIKIDTENTYADSPNKRIVVRSIHDLYFISVDYTYTDEEYLRMFDAVVCLFSALNIDGIAGDKTKLQFCIESAYGVEASISCVANDADPLTSFPTIREKSEFEEGWFAVVSHD